MKYFYYSLYLFYKKVVRLKLWDPIVNITAVMGLLLALLLSSVINAYRDILNLEYSWFILMIPASVALILYEIFYKYYEKRESQLLKEMESKPLWVKILAILLSFCFIILVVKLWMFDGMSDLFRFIKYKLM